MGLFSAILQLGAQADGHQGWRIRWATVAGAELCGLPTCIRTGVGNPGLVLLQNADYLTFGEPTALRPWSNQLGSSLPQTGLDRAGIVSLGRATSDKFAVV